METEIKNERTYYYKIVSPCGIESEKLSPQELDYYLKEGYFTVFLVLGNTGNIYQARKFKVDKIYRYTEKTIVTEEEFSIEDAKQLYGDHINERLWAEHRSPLNE